MTEQDTSHFDLLVEHYLGPNPAKSVFTHAFPIHWTKNGFSRWFSRLLKLTD
jgi:hypothetical protein